MKTSVMTMMLFVAFAETAALNAGVFTYTGSLGIPCLEYFFCAHSVA